MNRAATSVASISQVHHAPDVLPTRSGGFVLLHVVLASVAIALMVFTRFAGAAELALARDLAAEAKQAAVDGKIYVVLFGARDCSWCVKVRRNYLAPLNKPTADFKIAAREIDIESDVPLTDFDGGSTTHRAFAQARGIRFTPVVAFFDARGNELAESILGMASEDFYGAYLEERLVTARTRSDRAPRSRAPTATAR